MTEAADVVVIGAGPAGLGAASAARKAGAGRVIVLDRAALAGGVPRHCGHSPFGMREFGRVLNGTRYADRLTARGGRAGAEIRLSTHVVRLGEGGTLTLATPAGSAELAARRVILATGAREMPRASRLVTGDRPLGVLTAGALQNFVHAEGLRPFRRPLIVGTELVSFSAVMTCRAFGIRPVAMVEENTSATARWPCALLPLALGIPLLYGSRVTEIVGRDRVEAVQVSNADGESRIACDGVLFTGRFMPSAELVRASHLALDGATGGPVVDQFGRCSDPAYFAAGNILRPVESAGWSWAEGQRVGRDAIRDLSGELPRSEKPIVLSALPGLRFVVPQRLVPAAIEGGLGALQLRVDRQVKGRLTVAADGIVLRTIPISTRPERRILVPLAGIGLSANVARIALSIEGC